MDNGEDLSIVRLDYMEVTYGMPPGPSPPSWSPPQIPPTHDGSSDLPYLTFSYCVYLYGLYLHCLHQGLSPLRELGAPDSTQPWKDWYTSLWLFL